MKPYSKIFNKKHKDWKILVTVHTLTLFIQTNSKTLAYQWKNLDIQNPTKVGNLINVKEKVFVI